jgi:Cu-processing system permease protein
LGALGIAGDRERGALMYLLAQPVTVGEVLLGKYLGLGAALAAAVGLGFGVSGLVMAWQGGAKDVSGYLALAGLSVLLAVATLSIGFLLSASARKGATAIGVALFVWLVLAFFSDLGLMGAATVANIGPLLT